MSAEQIISKLAGMYEVGDFQPDADQRTAAFWWGAADEEAAWWLALCNRVSPDSIASHLYIAHVSEDVGHKRQIKDWAYRVAVDFVGRKGSGQRQRSMVESYRTDWGHQAARDGVAIALWGHDGVPGIVARAERFKCGKQAYQRVRDEVTRCATDLIVGFRADMEQCRRGRFSRDFIGRWESATGREWVAP